MKEKVGGLWNKIFMEIFGRMLHGFLPFSPVSLTKFVLILVWFERSFPSAQVSGQTYP